MGKLEMEDKIVAIRQFGVWGYYRQIKQFGGTTYEQVKSELLTEEQKRTAREIKLVNDG